MTDSATAYPSASITERTFVATADGLTDPPPPIKGMGRLLAGIIPANLGIFLVWGSVPGLLMPHQIELLDPANKVANLGIVATVGAVVALIAQPLAGQLSDRTRTRLGRRTPWILLGALAGGLALTGLAFANTLLGIGIAWSLVQIGYNFTQGPLSAVLPDRVPVARRGTFSALAGIGLLVGGLLGAVLGSLFFGSLTAGYITFAVIGVLALGGFVLFNPDYSSAPLPREPFHLTDFLRTFWVNPITHPDFFWAFTGRFLLYLGFFIATGYAYFILSDYIHVPHAETLIPLVSLASLPAMLISMLVSGPISDRVGRRKPFVFASSLVLCAALLIPILLPTVPGWFLFNIIGSLGFGMFGAVDGALMSEVLPSAKSFAKDLGVVNIAATLPQTLAPAAAAVIVTLFGYVGLFPVAIALGILGACAVLPIKAVR